MSEEFCVIFVTCKIGEAGRIAKALVDERLVACCNIMQKMQSIYRWKGKVYNEEETLIIMKTRRGNFEKVRTRVKELHSYSVPEIIALPIVEGHAPYLDWIRDETK